MFGLAPGVPSVARRSEPGPPWVGRVTGTGGSRQQHTRPRCPDRRGARPVARAVERRSDCSPAASRTSIRVAERHGRFDHVIETETATAAGTSGRPWRSGVRERSARRKPYPGSKSTAVSSRPPVHDARRGHSTSRWRACRTAGPSRENKLRAGRHPGQRRFLLQDARDSTGAGPVLHRTPRQRVRYLRWPSSASRYAQRYFKGARALSAGASRWSTRRRSWWFAAAPATFPLRGPEEPDRRRGRRRPSGEPRRGARDDHLSPLSRKSSNTTCTCWCAHDRRTMPAASSPACTRIWWRWIRRTPGPTCASCQTPSTRPQASPRAPVRADIARRVCRPRDAARGGRHCRCDGVRRGRADPRARHSRRARREPGPRAPRRFPAKP